ncbi:MAG: FAD:protein FMN transferase [Deinococcales bacterium]
MQAPMFAPSPPFGRGPHAGPDPELEERSFRALGTEVRVLGRGADRAEVEMRRLESLLTRFQPSALTALNERGAATRPPAELVSALRHALSVAEETGGLVTPLVLPALRWAGYRDAWPAPAWPSRGAPPEVADWRGVSVSDDAIRLPDGAEVDLGGTGKSWIAERCFELLEGEALLDAGGDVISRSVGAVAIDLAHPFGEEPLQVVLPPGRWALATSGVLARAWRGGHHLIDPRTARPADTRFVQATAVHPDLRRAEVTAKLALLTPDRTSPLLDAAIVVTFDRSGAGWRLGEDGDWRRL